MKSWAVLFSVGFSLTTVSYSAVVQYTTVGFAGWTGAEVREIRNGKIAGFRYENLILGRREEGFIQDISTQTTSSYSYPGQTSTQIYAISTTDNSRVGGMIYSSNLFYQVFGFAANSSNTSTNKINPPVAYRSSVESINGTRTVGWYDVDVFSNNKGFLHEGSDYSTGYTTVAYPNVNSSSTRLTGIQGDILVGTTTISGKNYGFAYDINRSTNPFSPIYLVPDSTDTKFHDINDNFIVGTAVVGGVNKPFLYNTLTGSSEFFTSPEGFSAEGYSYDNGIIAGTYTTASGEKLGFYANVPEPSTSFLMGLGFYFLAWANNKRFRI